MGNNMGVESCIQTTLDGTVIIDIEVQPGSSRQGVVGCNEWRGKLQVAVKAVPSLAGLGSTVQTAAVGAVLSKVNGTFEVDVLPAASAVVAVASPDTWPGPVPAVAVHTT